LILRFIIIFCLMTLIHAPSYKQFIIWSLCHILYIDFSTAVECFSRNNFKSILYEYRKLRKISISKFWVSNCRCGSSYPDYTRFDQVPTITVQVLRVNKSNVLLTPMQTHKYTDHFFYTTLRIVEGATKTKARKAFLLNLPTVESKMLRIYRE